MAVFHDNRRQTRSAAASQISPPSANIHHHYHHNHHHHPSSSSRSVHPSQHNHRGVQTQQNTPRNRDPMPQSQSHPTPAPPHLVNRPRAHNVDSFNRPGTLPMPLLPAAPSLPMSLPPPPAPSPRTRQRTQTIPSTQHQHPRNAGEQGQSPPHRTGHRVDPHICQLVGLGIPPGIHESQGQGQDRFSIQQRLQQRLESMRVSAAAAAMAHPTGQQDDELPAPKETGEDMTMNLECRACLSQPIDTVFLPCGHAVMCRWCAEEYMPSNGTHPKWIDARCPLCRAPVIQKVGLPCLERKEGRKELG